MVGGTNIGKSVVFNHLAGFGPVPPAAGLGDQIRPVWSRKGYASSMTCPAVSGFVLREWAGADEPLKEEGKTGCSFARSDQTPAIY